MDKGKLSVTFGVIAYNEQEYLPDLLSDFLRQTYPKNLIEAVLVDGESEDDTWKIMKTFQRDYGAEYKDIKTIKNPKKNQPAGWNIVIRNAASDVLFRIDAHARLPEDFIEKNVICIVSGEEVCGGPRENVIDDHTPWKRVLLDAELSIFGSGIASYRQKTNKRKYVKSVFHGAYRKEVIDTVGLFNEKLIRTEDNEYHYRIREAGYKICYDPHIKSYYQTRNSLKGMIKQKYQNGLWVGKTLFVCPKCISIFHLIPLVFILSLMTALVFMVNSVLWPIITIFVTYSIFLLLITFVVLIKKRNAMDILLPFIIFSIHCSYGLGTLAGIISKK